MNTVYKFVIQGKLWSHNEEINMAKTHWGSYRKERDAQLERIGWAITEANNIPAMNRIDIRIEWYEKNKKRDKQNVLEGGLKLICDALIEMKIIENDRWKEIGKLDIDNFFVDKLNPRIEVYLKEAK